MTRRFFTASAGLVLFCLFSLGCTSQDDDASPAESLPASHWFELTIGEQPIRVQLALTHAEMAKGLMARTSLGADDGMLFAYRRPKSASFWMKNTPLPLDIGFFDSEGVLLEVYHLYPYDETSVQSRSRDVQFALETNQNWFSQNNIRSGAKMNLEQLRTALKARGFKPADFGLAQTP